ncbi:MAG: hypothetical protein M8357_03040 [Desulfobulbaceae bacterium]|nr:hypothetical protein [Desulfobulbaceae bacterium]
MPFRKLPGNRGQIYVPECNRCEKKNPCPDCFNCQWCGNERCRLCRPDDYAEKRKSPPEHPVKKNGS